MTSEQQNISEAAISAEQVTDYLRSHPNFFDQHATLLTEITLPNPHGSGVISLAERQQLAQRDKIRVIEAMMAEMIAHAEENDAISEKVHQLGVKLINQQTFSALQQQVADILKQEFSVTDAAMRIWVKPSNSAITQDAIFSPVSEEFSDWVMNLAQPHCGTKPSSAPDLLAENIQSFAFIPLGSKATNQRPFGVLILGSADQQRFKADMGTLYIERVGELLAAALLNHLFALHL